MLKAYRINVLFAHTEKEYVLYTRFKVDSLGL